MGASGGEGSGGRLGRAGERATLRQQIADQAALVAGPAEPAAAPLPATGAHQKEE